MHISIKVLLSLAGIFFLLSLGFGFSSVWTVAQPLHDQLSNTSGILGFIAFISLMAAGCLAIAMSSDW